ncbi:hypothetical protein [Thioclava sp. DLFJ5-1]|nr:hypothetical protein [Thioclava sp. DLFJ5-1]
MPKRDPLLTFDLLATVLSHLVTLGFGFALGGGLALWLSAAPEI